MENTTKQNLDTAETKLEKIVHDSGRSIGTIASGLAHSVSDYATTSRDFVKENPTKGIAIAATAGAVAGSLLTLALSRRCNKE